MNGVTRQKVIDLCRENAIPVFEKNYSLYEAYGADEAFLTGRSGRRRRSPRSTGRRSGRVSGPSPRVSAILIRAAPRVEV